jgi:signal peptidase
VVLVPLVVLMGTAFLFGWTFQPIETGSMAPQYPAGALAVVQPMDGADVRPGMTVVFTDPQDGTRLVAHRVVKALPGDPPAWQTKGDANAEPDPLPVPARAIRGRVLWVVPALGSLVTAIRGPQAVILFVGIPLGVLGITEVADRRRRTPRGRPAATG